MSEKTPRVWGQYLEDPLGEGRPIPLDTAGWWIWLEAPSTRSFSYPVFDPREGYIVGFMTVRKERREPGRSYWSVYRRAGRGMRRIYLGKSATVTQQRLDQMARAFLEGRPADEAADTDV
jgi:hypothetical protein